MTVKNTDFKSLKSIFCLSSERFRLVSATFIREKIFITRLNLSVKFWNTLYKIKSVLVYKFSSRGGKLTVKSVVVIHVFNQKYIVLHPNSIWDVSNNFQKTEVHNNKTFNRNFYRMGGGSTNIRLLEFTEENLRLIKYRFPH